MKKVVLLVAPGFEEVEAVTPLDFLRRAGIEVFAAGLDHREVTGAHGITLVCDGTLADIPGTIDGVVIPGGMPGASHIAENAEALKLIRGIYDAGGLVAAICAAPAVVLGGTGILSGRRATCYPGFHDRLGQDVQHASDRIVRDGNIVTSQGPGTAAEFAIEIIRYFLGDEAAQKIHTGTLQK
jgi:protein deglycase